jgi:hypothetical protein
MHTNRSLESGAFLQLHNCKGADCGRLCRESFQSVGAHAYAATSVYRTLFLFPYAATRRNEVVKSHMNSLRTLLVSSRPWSTQNCDQQAAAATTDSRYVFLTWKLGHHQHAIVERLFGNCLLSPSE